MSGQNEKYVLAIDIGTSSIEHDGHELVFKSGANRSITLNEMLETMKELKMVMEFIESSSLSEEFKEYKMFKRLRDD